MDRCSDHVCSVSSLATKSYTFVPHAAHINHKCKLRCTEPRECIKKKKKRVYASIIHSHRGNTINKCCLSKAKVIRRRNPGGLVTGVEPTGGIAVRGIWQGLFNWGESNRIESGIVPRNVVSRKLIRKGFLRWGRSLTKKKVERRARRLHWPSTINTR